VDAIPECGRAGPIPAGTVDAADAIAVPSAVPEQWIVVVRVSAVFSGEHFDQPLLRLTGVVGGHPVKHVVAALAVSCIVCAVPAGVRGNGGASGLRDRPLQAPRVRATQCAAPQRQRHAAEAVPRC